MDAKLITVTALVILALAFDFINGFHDAANSIATVVSTRVLGPRTAVAGAALANFAAFFVKTMGMRLTTLKPFGGFCAETGGSVAIFTATALGVPVSTTHTITGAIVGVGTVSRPGSVRWSVATRILWAWILTLPASAAMSILTYHIVRALGM